jgi:hemolysin III
MSTHRPCTLQVEAAHAISHGVGAALALAGLAVLVGAAAWRRDPWQVVGAAVFGFTLLALYSAWTICHAVRTPRAKDIWRRPEHAAISLLIVTGWLVLVALRPLASAVGADGLAWLVAGGLSYAVGVVFDAWRQLRDGHFVWHLFVLGGSACHFVAVLVTPAHAQGAQRRLQEIGRTSVGNAVLLEPRSVVRTDTLVTAAVRVRFEKPVRSATGEIRSSRTIAMFDCRTGYVAVKENWYYGDADGTKVVDHKVVGKPGFSSPIKGTLPDIAGRHLCAKAP